jgi:tape measure domain-containing protein
MSQPTGQPIASARVTIVPDFSGFGAQTKEGVQRELLALQSTVQNVMGTTEREFAQAGRNLGTEFSQGGQRAQFALREVSAQANSSFNNVERQADEAANHIQGHLGGAISFVRTGLLTLATATIGGLTALTAFGLKSAATLEQTQIAFNSLLGSVDAGTKAFKDLQQFAAVTPFEFKDIAPAAQRFFAFGQSVGLAKDQVIGFLTTLGNVASVTGGGAQALSSVTLAMGQIASAGKVTLDNLNQISEALPGFSGVAAIAAGTGKTTAEVMQEISSGSLDATTGIQALLKGMAAFPGAAGAMEAQSKTLLGVFSTFKDTLSQALVAGFTPAIPAIKDALNEVTPVLGAAIAKIAPALGQVIAVIGPLVGQLVDAVVPILQPLIEGVREFFQSLQDTGALAQLSAAIGKVVQALSPLFPILGQLVNTLATALVPVIEALAPVAAEIAPAIAEITIALLPLIPPLAQILVSVIQLITPLIRLIALWDQFATAQILVPIVTALADALTVVAGAIQFVSDAFNGVSVDGAISVFSGIVDFFTSLPGKIGDALSALPGILVNALTFAFDTFFEALGFAIGRTIRFFMDLPDNISRIWSDFWTNFGVLASRGIDNFVAFIRSLPDRAVTGFHELVARAKAAGEELVGILKSLPSRAAALGKDIWNGLIGGIKDGIGAAISAGKRAMSDFVNGIKEGLGIHSPSMVFRTEVGRQIPPGIGLGVTDAMPALRSLLNQATSGLVTAAAGAAGQTGAPGGGLFGPGSIVVNVSGNVTPAQAQTIGQAVGAGIADTLSRRNIATAGRTV